jgi:hypothetical protein
MYGPPDVSLGLGLSELQACAAALAEGAMTATTAVETLGKLLARVRRYVANRGRQAGPADPGRADAPWWNQECEAAHAVCEAHRRAAQGRPRTSRAWKPPAGSSTARGAKPKPISRGSDCGASSANAGSSRARCGTGSEAPRGARAQSPLRGGKSTSRLC